MPSDNKLPTPNSYSPVTDALQLGAVSPTYTWRKGGTKDPHDNHLWLSLTAADDLLVPEDDALIEIDPETKHVKFWATTELLDGVSFGENFLEGSTIKDGTISSDKLEPGIVIDGSITKLTTARNINGVLFDGTSNAINYGVCNTGAGIAAKTVSINNFELINGATITVKFANNNTANNPTLNVSDTGAKPIFYRGARLDKAQLTNNRYFTFVYDGTNYNVVGDLYIDTSTDENVTVTAVTDNQQYNLIGTENNSSYTGHINSFNSIKYNPNTSTLSVNHINSDVGGTWNQINAQTAGIINNISSNSLKGLITSKGSDGVFTITGTNNSLIASYTTNSLINDQYDGNSYQVSLLDSNGNSEFPGNITAPRLIGTADTATRAVNDANGNRITSTYATKVELNNYLRLTGGEITGNLYVPPINDELNVRVSTCGWVTTQIQNAVDQIVGTGSGGSDISLSSLSQQIQQNTTNIASLTTTVNAIDDNYVRYSSSQSLNNTQKSTARSNIGAFSSTGGTITGNVAISGSATVTGTTTSNNHIKITNSGVTIGNNPTSTVNRAVTFTDKTGANGHSMVRSTVANSGAVTTELMVKPNKSDGSYSSIAISVNNSGTVTTSAPNPRTGSDDRSIATTSWVNDAIADALVGNAQALADKTYNNVVAANTLTTLEQGLLYFTEIKPDDNLTGWRADYLIEISTPYDSYNAIAFVQLIGVGQSLEYQYDVAHKSADTISFDGFNYRAATTNTLASGKGHYFGLSLYRSTNPSSTTYARTINVKLLKAENCQCTLVDSIGNADDFGITDSSHQSNLYVDTSATGLYYPSNINYGDRLSVWDRRPVAGSAGLTNNTLVAENSSGQLVGLFNGTSLTTTSIKPYSILYYTGVDLASNRTGTADGTLFNVHRFSLSSIGATSLANSTIYIEGTIDINSWLFKCERLTSSMTNSKKQYVLLGYSNATYGYLTTDHIVFGKIGSDSFKPITAKPLITTPAATSNDNTIATTAFVRSSITNGLINPSINSDVESETYINLHAYEGSFTKASLPSEQYSNAIYFYDGSGNEEETNLLGWVSQDSITNQISVSTGIQHPTSTSPTQNSQLVVGYKKSGSSWTSFATAPQPPTTDNSNAIATTKYVQDNLEKIDEFLQVIDCGEIP